MENSYITDVRVVDNDTAYVGWTSGATARVLWQWDNALDNIRKNLRPYTKLVDERVPEDKEKFPFDIGNKDLT